MEALWTALGPEVDDVDEETFDLFSQPSHLQDLGMLDPKAATLDVTVAGQDYTFTQSPGILHSPREGGTTGAVLWKTSVAVADWISQPGNALIQHGLFSDETTVLELGSGISGLVPQVLASTVQKVIATDQHYLLKTLRANIVSARSVPSSKLKSSRSRPGANICVLALDWEEDDVQSQLRSHGLGSGVDVVVACDCIFNYALIEPFVQTCADICQLRCREGCDGRPTACLIAQHLRQADVFEQWLTRFMQQFHVWRVPENLLGPKLKEGSGLAVHIGLLRDRR